MNRMLTPCNHCPHFYWCEKYGCTTWNDYSRLKFNEVARRSKESNDWIDEFERNFPGDVGGER